MTRDEFQALLELITDEQDKYLAESKTLEAKGDEDAATQAFIRAITCRQLLWRVMGRFDPRRNAS
jgi:hypothetical protein